jgi:hypothetical protein
VLVSRCGKREMFPCWEAIGPSRRKQSTRPLVELLRDGIVAKFSLNKDRLEFNLASLSVEIDHLQV